MLALRGDFANQDIPRLHLGTDDDNTVFVQVAQAFLRDVRDVAGDLLGSEFSLTHLHVKVLDVDGGELVVFHQAGGNHDGVVHVVAAPGHKGDQEVFTERQLAVRNRGAFNQDVTLLNFLAAHDLDALVVAAVIVGLLEMLQRILFLAVFVFDDDRDAVCLHHLAGGCGDYDLRSV